jgi:hypothetical protein
MSMFYLPSTDGEVSYSWGIGNFEAIYDENSTL